MELRSFLAEARTKSKLASLNEKLDMLERRLEVLEVQVCNSTDKPSLFTADFNGKWQRRTKAYMYAPSHLD